MEKNSKKTLKEIPKCTDLECEDCGSNYGDPFCLTFKKYHGDNQKIKQETNI